MPTVITFWQTPEDAAEFWKHLAGEQLVIVYPSGPQAHREGLSAQPLDAYLSGKPCVSVLLSPARCAGYVFIEEVETERGREYAISPASSPVLGFRPGTLEGNRLTPANAHVYWELVRDGRLVKQPEVFVKWSKAVLNWLRKRAGQRVEGKGLPMTRRARELMDRGVELANY